MTWIPVYTKFESLLQSEIGRRIFEIMKLEDLMRK